MPALRTPPSGELSGPGVVAALARIASALGDAALAAPGSAVSAALADAAQACTEADRAAGAEQLAGLPELLRLLGAGLRSRAARVDEPLGDGEAAVLLGWASTALDHASGHRDVAIARQLVAGLREVPWIPSLAPRLEEYLVTRLAAAPRVPEAKAAQGAATAVAEPVAGPSSGLFAAAPLAPAADESPDVAAATTPDDVLWVAPEELELAAGAVQERLLPLAESLATAPADEQPALAAEAGWQCQLLANAVGMLNLPALSAVLGEVADDLPRCADGDRAELLAGIATATLGMLAAPGPDAAQLLVELRDDPRWPTRPADGTAAALRAEAARIVVGTDPAVLASRQRIATAEDVDLRIPADAPPAVVSGLLRELPDRSASLSSCLQWLAKSPDDDARDTARRLAHTIKGDANTVGVRGLAELAHALEDVLDELARRRQPPSPALSELLAHAGDVIESIAEHLAGRGPAPADLLDVLQQLIDATRELHGDAGGASVPEPSAPAPSAAAAAAAAAAPAAAAPAAPAPLAPSTAPAEPAEAMPEATLTVPVRVLDELLRLVGESIVMSRQVERRVAAIGDVQREFAAQRERAREVLGRLDDLVALRGAALQSARLAAGGATDPLELDQYNELHVVTRRLIEADSDDSTQLQSVARELLRLDDLIARQDRTQVELQQSVLRARTLPFRSIAARLQRAVRQAARTVLKDVELEIRGPDTPIDSEVLERLAEPLTHALRNAVDHGIEPSAQRTAAGKPAAGRIVVSAARDGNRVYLEVADDGRGLDHAAIRARAIERGLLPADAPAPAEVLARMILRPGFSTRDTVSQVSGRGIGMDVVAQRVAELRGRLRVDSRPGEGLTLRIELPASLTSAHAAIARVGEGWAAVATSGVQRFVPVFEGALTDDADGLSLSLDGYPVRALWLESLFGQALPRQDAPARLAAVVVDDTGVQHAILLREVEGMREVIVRGLGPWVPPLAGVRGATILGSGAVAPVIDLAPLLAGAAVVAAADSPDADSVDIVVADDSLSVRRALAQMLGDVGLSVRTARDGLEALDLVKARRPALLVVDLEMPRMNGLDLTAYLRTQPATAGLPVLMVTSRTAETHQRLAFEAGVDEMLPKPVSDDALLAAVMRLLESGRPTRRATDA